MKALQITVLWMLIPVLTWAQNSHSIFLDHSYRLDSATICGQVLNRTTQAVPNIKFNHFITDELVNIPISLDSLGNFSVKVPIYSTTQLFIYYITDGTVLSMFVEPGENISISSDWKINKVAFKGKYGAEHQQVYDYYTYLDSINWPYTNFDSFQVIPHEQYLQELKQYTFKNDSILDAYAKQNPGLTRRSREEIRIGNYNRSAGFLMQRRFTLDRANGEKFTKEYMDYADSVFASLPRPYTVASRTFLRDYLDYYIENKQTPAAFKQAVIDYAIKEKRITPTEEQKKNPLKILNSNEFSRILSDVFNELKEKKYFVRMMLDYYNGGALIVPMPVDLKELVTTQAFYKYLDQTRIALSDAHVEYYKQQVKSPELRKFVLDYQNKLAALEKNQLEFSASLKDAAPFKDCKSGEEIFSRLIAPHKGKIIYLDIWGTWCGPCKKEMQFTRPVKEAMKGKDIVFLYLANNSSDISLRNVIKENHLTGEQVEHYNLPSLQQNMVEKYLKVSSFPTYLIIDREGKIIDNDALRPSRGKYLIEHLNELLSR